MGTYLLKQAAWQLMAITFSMTIISSGNMDKSFSMITKKILIHIWLKFIQNMIELSENVLCKI